MPDTRTPRRRKTTVNPTVEPEPKQEAPKDEKINTPPPEPAPARMSAGAKQTVLEKKIERMIVAMGLPFAAAGDMHCARHFTQKGPIVAEAWANLANESPAVKEILESMMKGSAWTGAIGATCGLLIPVAAHHGAPLPPVAARLFGAEVPEQPKPQPEPPIVPTPTPVANGNGNGNGRTVPGPAAFSAPPDGTVGSDTLAGDPRDPGAYPGP